MPNNRQSNIELLRILAMFLVLVYHSIFLRNGWPNNEVLAQQPTTCFTNIFLYTGASVCVNLFILISGWFGIHPKKKSLFAFIFQVLFYFFLGNTVGWLTGTLTMDGTSLFNVLTLSTGYWFVYAYLGLFLFAPVLNAYIEKVGQKQFRYTILLFYLLQTWYGWLRPQEAPFFYGGHSTISFVGLYLVARYCRLYHTLEKIHYPFAVYLGLALGTAAICWGMLYKHIPGAYVSMLCQYISPAILAASLLLFASFTQMKGLKSKTINRIAFSAFSVYLIHTHEAFYVYMERAIHFLQNEQLWYPVYLTLLLLLLVVIFLLCTAVDQIRILLWKQISCHFFPESTTLKDK